MGEKRWMNKEKLLDAVMEQMLLHFSCADYDPDDDMGDGRLHNFWRRN